MFYTMTSLQNALSFDYGQGAQKLWRILGILHFNLIQQKSSDLLNPKNPSQIREVLSQRIRLIDQHPIGKSGGCHRFVGDFGRFIEQAT